MKYLIVNENGGAIKHRGTAKDFDGVISSAKKQANKLGLRKYTMRFESVDEGGAKYIQYGPSRCMN
jgi:hypothetical protein